MTANKKPSPSEVDLAYTLLLEDLTLAVIEADANLDLAGRIRELLERFVNHGAMGDSGSENHRRMISALIQVRETETILRGQRDALGANLAFYEQRREAHRRGVPR